MMKFLTLIKEKMMEKLDTKHIKKIKPQKTNSSKFGEANGGHPCPPVGSDILVQGSN
jgi:hypothetical protein